jgi:hypothetical protein
VEVTRNISLNISLVVIDVVIVFCDRFVRVSYITRLDRFIRNVFYAVVAQWQRITFLQLYWWQVGVAGSTPVDGIWYHMSHGEWNFFL